SAPAQARDSAIHRPAPPAYAPGSCSATGPGSGDAEAQAEAPDLRRVLAPVRRPAVARDVVDPAAAADHPTGGLRGTGWVGLRRLTVIARVIAVPAPLPHVAVQVMQAEGVRRLPADGMRLAAGVLGVPGVPAQLRRVVAEGVRPGAPGPAGILPLR